MTRKLFSLIYGEKHTIAANRKVIPAVEVSQLLDAQEVLSKVHADAEKYRLDVAKECETLKETAQQDGFAAGYQKWANAIAELEGHIHDVRQEIQKMLIPAALKAAKKIVGREMELSETTIVDIVANTLKAVSQHKKITIYANRRDVEILEKNRQRLKEVFENLEVLSIAERSDVARGGCVVETEGGIINAQLENQWSALERAFSALMVQKEKDATADDTPIKEEEEITS